MEKKKRPIKQRWLGNPPTSIEIQTGKAGFSSKGLLEQLIKIANDANLYPLTVGPRSDSANTVPRCYMFISAAAYEKGYENIACIDIPSSKLRLIVRPFGRGLDRECYIPIEICNKFVKSDLPDWKHLIINSDPDVKIAIKTLQHIRKKYIDNYEL